MTQARDELFVKLALRQGLFSKPEAVQFLQRYRAEGARGEGIGHWLVAEGVVTEEQAEVIRLAIENRAEGHVAESRRRVPKRAAARSPAGGGARAQAHAQAHPHAPHPHHSHLHQHGPRTKAVTPGQQVLFIGSGVAAIGLVIFLIFQFQKETPRLADLGQDSGTTTEQNETADQIADRISGAGVSPATAETPRWTDQEIETMKGRMRDAINLARNHVGDGRPGRGIESIEKRAAELGDTLPPEIQTMADTELAELRTIADEIYADALEALREAKASGDEDEIEALILELEDTCGETYAERAKKEIE